MALAPLVWPLLSGSWRLHCTEPATRPGAGPVIFACLHRDFLPAITYVRPAQVVLLVSNSPDGDILVRTLGGRGYDFVRGSTGADGGRAFVAVRRLVEAGRNVGIAVDGPEGPFGAIHEGVYQLARRTGAPIVPLLARAEHPQILATWDRTVVPLPFTRVEILRGEPLHVAPDQTAGDLAGIQAELERFFGVEGASP